jgi:hypothetical protein
MRILAFIVALALLLLTGPAHAQAPPVTPSAAPSAAPPPNPHAAAPNPQAQDPHGRNPHAQVRDMSQDAPDLPAGTLEVTIADADERPLPGVEVSLEILFSKISEGESRSQKRVKTDAEGRVRFTGLATTSDYAYQVAVSSGGGLFASSQFRLRDNAGYRVLLHVFATTSDFERTVVMAMFLSVETRDDVFQLNAVLHVFNVSRMAFIPKDVVISLPEGFKAFAGEDSMFDSRAEQLEGRGATLKGTFPPGERKVRFRFQLSKATEQSVTFSVGLPRNVMQAQVLATASPEMNLEVANGFPTPEVGKTEMGDRFLQTQRMIKRGEEPIRELTITLTGLRVPGIGRLVAVAIAFALACLGGLAANGMLDLASAEKVQGDRDRARELILSELVSMERAKASGALGPNAYERAHRALVDALARIGIPDEKKLAKKKKVAKT